MEEVKLTVPKIIGIVFGILMLFYALGFLATGGDLAIYSFWAPKQANAENKVFHNTQAYTDGKITYIGKLCREREAANNAADGPQKRALESEIANEASTIDNAKLPADEQACINSSKGY